MTVRRRLLAHRRFVEEQATAVLEFHGDDDGNKPVGRELERKKIGGGIAEPLSSPTEFRSDDRIARDCIQVSIGVSPDFDMRERSEMGSTMKIAGAMNCERELLNLVC